MNNTKRESKKTQNIVLHYLEALTDTAREPFLILSADLKVLAANPFFYKTFGVAPRQTKNHFIYELGNGQWDIPELKKMLENVLPEKKIIIDFDVEHDFPKIGKKIMRLNAQQIDAMQLIVIAFEDVTKKEEIQRNALEYTNKLEAEVTKRTAELQSRVTDLEELTNAMVGRELKMSELKKEIARIKKLKKLNNHNDANGLG